MAVEVPRVMTPDEAAALSGLPAQTLSKLCQLKGYPFTPTRIGGQPGKRCGKGWAWGLTAAQLAAIVEGQQERFNPPAEAQPETQAKRNAAAAPKFVPPGGKSRLARKRMR